MVESGNLLVGDCLQKLTTLVPDSVDLCYIDPPFFSQRRHKLVTRDGAKAFQFEDIWEDYDDYAHFLFERIHFVKRCLKDSGSVFVHCDQNASHVVRMVLERIFGRENFQSEIIWHFRRWSNSKRGLLPAHQTIFFYSKTKDFQFYPQFTEYSPTTNVDQLMRKRGRDFRNKSIYAKDEQGNAIFSGAKKGVPLSDVWEIPFLNPKARERVGYPTQKPLQLLMRIVELVSRPGDLVLDPFCGSGTTLVAAQELGRRYVGIDKSEDAIALAQSRLEDPVVTKSALLLKGKDVYRQHDEFASKNLANLDYTPIHRNKGVDGILKSELEGRPVFVRVQRPDETVSEAASLLRKALRAKGDCVPVLIQTHEDLAEMFAPEDIKVVPSTSYLLALDKSMA